MIKKENLIFSGSARRSGKGIYEYTHFGFKNQDGELSLLRLQIIALSRSWQNLLSKNKRFRENVASSSLARRSLAV